MALDFDSYLGIHAKSLVLRDQRASLLANNLANIDTPNFKAQDMDFNTLLQANMAAGAEKLDVTSSRHINPNAELIMHTKAREGATASFDGNTVDRDKETTEFTKNAMQYQASLSFLDGKIKSMIHALRGE